MCRIGIFWNGRGNPYVNRNRSRMADHIAQNSMEESKRSALQRNRAFKLNSTESISPLKEQFTPKFKSCCKFTHLQDIQDVDFEMEQNFEMFCITLMLTNGSSAVNGCRQNEITNNW